MNAWSHSTRAELRRLMLWPATWVLGGVWITLLFAFAYAFPYIAYRSGDADAFQGGPTAELLASMLPQAAPAILIQGTPMFGGAVAMIFAALTVGNAYSWGTWKTVLTQGPGRVAAAGGTVTAIGVCVAGLVLFSTVFTLGLSSLVAGIESQALVWPDWGDMAASVGGTALVLGMWAAGGVFLGVLTRGPALSVGLGLLWTLVVENLLRGVSQLIDGMPAVVDRLPGSSAGSLAGALSSAAGGAEGTPGVLDALSGPVATGMLVGYLVVFVALALTLIKRRDVA
ncbi:ABC transporter permease [Glycomyces arizonensis]|uniref:ABC transporter permease n=1 Tax=Glycomyces arizonensis TaxID=256035 RepID=UPI00041DBF63|nr:ABC transporter permease subunit [Glycomyces arizonensis]